MKICIYSFTYRCAHTGRIGTAKGTNKSDIIAFRNKLKLDSTYCEISEIKEVWKEI